ncbi:MAG: LexA family transcriptional regulator [Pyramidobacter porci]|uniref:LexA family transcriptional regulator n=1 Tax=Pyramidobacter porci TaxID=2605789 RepID=UPI002A75C1DC|nr:LexA family transcriptional regulator [Pyramidobacter porci]MDY2649196.1 LexA family transcriptional regulator [Pyramidobacter porci]
MLGKNLEKIRENAKLSRRELGQLINVGQNTIWRWEHGEREPSLEKIQSLAVALNVSVSDLMDREENKKAPTNESEGKKQNIRFVGDMMRVPVVSREMTACCGPGIGAMDVTSESEEPVWISRSELRAYDDLRPPFAIYADGDCLASDDIKSEDKVIINPAEDAQNGSIVLVRMYGMLSLKRYYRLPNDTVVLRSDDGEQRLTPKKQEDADFAIIGVMVGFFRGRPGLRSF